MTNRDGLEKELLLYIVGDERVRWERSRDLEFQFIAEIAQKKIVAMADIWGAKRKTP